MAIAFVFPGQGSQSVGMGKDLADNFAEARAVFSEVDDTLSQPLSRIMWEGPEAELTLTENAQPALMAVSMAVMRVLEAQFGISVAGSAVYLAGHSLGEYSAHAAAGTFSLADTARLLKVRGKAMQAAAPVGVGAMAAILGLDFDSVAAAASEAAQGDVCQVANDNSDGQVVISGHKVAVERASEIAKAKGAKRAVMLPVSAPFHCALMDPAARAMDEALHTVKQNMSSPAVPVVANVKAAAVTDTDEIARLLVQQVTGTVRWRECVSFMTANGVGTFVEIGSGKVLTGLAKKNAPNAKAIAIGSPADIDAALPILKG
jgi:[acyl-carrier-protein] S-malonyltransferase